MHVIEKYIPERADIDRIATNFDRYSEKMGLPEYDAEIFAFRIFDNDKNIIADLFLKIVRGICEIKELYIDEEHRKEGLARELVKEAEVLSLEKGAKQVILWTFSWQGEGFYERLGFKQVVKIPVNIDKKYFNGETQFNILYRKEL